MSITLHEAGPAVLRCIARLENTDILRGINTNIFEGINTDILYCIISTEFTTNSNIEY